jgi:hypothetical protein
MGRDSLKKSVELGGAGYRSLCLLHAKQALYHLSYTPVNCRRPERKRMWRSRVSIPVPADCEPTALPSELHPLTTATKKYVLQPMGFEPMPLSRLAPKASALTTRPKLHLLPRLENRKTKKNKTRTQKNSPRGDSNPQPPDPKSDALSIAPLGHRLE